jgi:hypothetical protein
MERNSSAMQPPAGQEPSTGELVRQLSEQVSVLVHDELKLARLEMTRKGKQAGLGVGMLGAGGLTALYVGVVLLAVSAAAALLGKGRLQKAIPPVPDQAVGSQPGVGANTAVKTALTVAALGTTAYSGLLGARLGNAVDVKTEGGTVPAENTPDDVARIQRRLRILQWATPVLTGALVVLGAQQGEQQRPGQRIRSWRKNAG